MNNKQRKVERFIDKMKTRKPEPYSRRISARTPVATLTVTSERIVRDHRASWKAPWYEAVNWPVVGEWALRILAGLLFIGAGLFFYGPFVIRLWGEK